MGKKLFLTLLVIAVVSGCKVVVIVPEGGRVISESGAHVCNASESCEISVVDFFFDETFVAEPAETSFAGVHPRAHRPRRVRPPWLSVPGWQAPTGAVPDAA